MSATNTTFWKQWSTNTNNTVNNSNQTKPNPNPNPKFPGRVMKNNNNSNNSQLLNENPNKHQKQRTSSLSSMTSLATTPTRQMSATGVGQQHRSINHHKRNNSSSFEVFTASCADAWDSTIEDCLHSNTNTSNHSINSNCIESQTDSQTNNISSLLIRQSPSTSKPLKPVLTTNDEKPDVKEIKIDSKLNNWTESDPKLAKFNKIVFEDEVTDLNQLRSLAWAGIPNQVRPITWKLLLGYLPVVRSKRVQTLDRKRAEYQNLVQQYYYNRPENDECWRQIHIDIPRMQPLISIFQQNLVQGIFERILYIWSIRHPASGYVQGMNDLVTPFFVTYLSEFIPGNALSKVESFEVSTLTEETLNGVESDSFWSFTKLLDSIQDNYTFAQPGIQRLVNLLSCVVSRVDRVLHEHLERHSVQYLQFAFRWMNNLLIREIPLRCIVRLWDTYLAEGAVTTTALPTVANSKTISLNHMESTDSSTDFNSWTMGSGTPFSSAFHLFVCAAFLRFWSKNLLQEKDFQGLMLLLQNLPTFHWTDNEVRLLVADAYQLKYTFSPNHLKV